MLQKGYYKRLIYVTIEVYIIKRKRKETAYCRDV